MRELVYVAFVLGWTLFVFIVAYKTGRATEKTEAILKKYEKAEASNDC